MNLTNLAFNESNQESQNIPDWDYFTTEISKTFRFTPEETKWFSNCRTAKLIATIPFAAECIEPERTAIAHLCVYIAEIRGFQKYYAHQPSDDFNIFNRLALISTFEGGNKQIIKYGLNLLAFSMIEGYKKSYNYDEENKIYNPLVSKAWNYEELKETLETEISNSSNFLIDKIEFDPEEGWIK